MKTTINGIPIEFTDHGSGTAVLLIHGYPLNRRIWDQQIEDLLPEARVVAPDLRGHGNSYAPPGPYAMDQFADDLLLLMSALKIEKFAAVGHSMGGYITFALHRRAPLRLLGAALVASRAKADTDEARKVREETAQRAEREGVRFIAETMPDRLLHVDAPQSAIIAVRDIITTANSVGVAGALRGMASRPDATPQLAAMRLPVLVAAGRGDRVVPPAESEAMAASIEGSKLVWFEKSGHMPMLEEPATFSETLKAWVRTL
jgi:pimeloyl-ACP methyl ester carboxylesterase